MSVLTPWRLLLLCTLVAGASADPVISEFCASNQNGIRDDDGDRSDWIEIHNPDTVAVNLTDWCLSDNAAEPAKWRFPAVTLPAGGRIVVFASGKDRRIPARTLHTNFSLSAAGEYLGLIRADGIVASEYAPTFPPQYADLSYGIAGDSSTRTLVAESATCQWMVPRSASIPGSSWHQPEFTPTGWRETPQGIGYDRNTSGVNFLPEIGGNTYTDMMAAGSPSCYVRFPFTMPEGGTVTKLTLRAKYDDGFAAWLNGQPLLSGSTQARRNAPTTLSWNSAATSTHDDNLAINYVDIDVTASAAAVTGGDNLLAIQLLNQSLTSSDCLLRVQLVADISTGEVSTVRGYFGTPTPGMPNPGTSGMVIPQEVTFSHSSGTYSGIFQLTLSGASAGLDIRYTMDGSVPTASSPRYVGPISIGSSRVVRARVHDPLSGALGFNSAGSYEMLAESLSSYGSTGAPFRSSLPILVLNNQGRGELPDNNQATNTRLQVFDRDGTGYSSLAAGTNPALTVNVGAKLRGRSSSGFPKKSYGLEFLDENDMERAAEVLGMPEGSDWALIGCYNFDRAFSRNAWIYEVSRRAGRWAPRTRLVEVFFNQDGDSLEYADYRGVYILCETIRRDGNRVDIARLDRSHVTLPNVSGGYIFKVDAADSDEFRWTTNRSLPPSGTGNDGLVIHRPKLPDLMTQQSTWLRTHFQTFENTLYTEAAAGFTTRNYRTFIDSTSWVDHNIFSALPKNVDALRLSAYFHKDRGAPMNAGPIWDYDRSVNSTDNRDDDPRTWRGTSDATDYFTYAWWQRLFMDVEFRQLWVDRWQTLRRGPLATAEVNSILDGYLAEFRSGDADHPARRDYARWYNSPTSNNIISEITMMKSWISSRSEWIDGQLAAPPVITRPSGLVTAGETTTITVPAGLVVYYTLDGSDPRAEGGGFSPSAQTYTAASAPIVISASSRLRARTYRTGNYATPGTNWSGPVEALYLVDEVWADATNTRVSAVNYHPMEPTAAEAAALPGIDGSAFEWIELQNFSETTVNLQGVTMEEGAPAGAVTLGPFTLQPGERALIAKNPAAIALRYGQDVAARIAGTWSGDGSLDNAGDEIALIDRESGPLSIFAYSDGDGWPERADGPGSALVYTGAGFWPDDLQDPANWAASIAVHGTPGIGSPGSLSGVVIHEILPRPVAPALGMIELHNPTDTAVDLSGWYLANTADAVTEQDYRLFRIPNATVLEPGAYAVFDESDYNPNGAWNPAPGPTGEGEFVLDGARGGSLWLISAASADGKLRNFEQEVGWTPLLPGVAYGRTPDASADLKPLAAATPGLANAPARVGPVQVTEIHYHPAEGTLEFVEIANTGDSAEPLADWTLRGDVDFDFSGGLTLGAAEAIVMVAFDPEAQPAVAGAFRTHYGVAPGVRLVGPWSAGDTLGNDAGTARLRRKVPAPADEPDFIGRMIEDEVNYLAESPWPTAASGTGSSIQRLGIRGQGSDPASWMASAPGPGADVGGYFAWRAGAFGNSADGEPDADPDSDQLPNLLEYLLGTDPAGFTSLVGRIDGTGEEARFVLDYTRRTDRDDAVLSAWQSLTLSDWDPAENDGALSTDGRIEHRRAWLPATGKGFLRLQADDAE